ncbi:head GIN domain-containing protein [Adhaeribacter terreus]|uniref:Head GIN domain-containing protein n=1 Tax=Adhaeribacter terreus TaxID=529703 RepID=A0ABW0EF72_9BACT
MRSAFLKKHIPALFLLASVVSFSGCNKETLRGHGEVVSRTRTVGTFDEIDAGGEFEIYLTQGPAKEIVLEGQENILADLSTTTHNNRLKLKYHHHNVKIDEPVRIYITTPNLTEINVSGANKVQGLTDWKVRDLEISSSGSGEISLTLRDADYVESDISGSGKINLRGNAYHHDLDISGSGELNAFDFKTAKTDVHISGSGKSDVWVTDELKANISGSGRVRYKGNPSVSTSISGSGKVQKWD